MQSKANTFSPAFRTTILSVIHTRRPGTATSSSQKSVMNLNKKHGGSWKGDAWVSKDWKECYHLEELLGKLTEYTCDVARLARRGVSKRYTGQPRRERLAVEQRASQEVSRSQGGEQRPASCMFTKRSLIMILSSSVPT